MSAADLPSEIDNSNDNALNIACRRLDEASELQTAGRYSEAEFLFRSALTALETLEGLEHPDVANAANRLAECLAVQRRDLEAEALARRAGSITRQVLEDYSDELDADTVLKIEMILGESLAQLGAALRGQARFAEAEVPLRDAVGCATRAFGPNDARLATAYNNLGVLYKYWGKLDTAATSYETARRILEACDAAEPLALAGLYYNLGGLGHARGDYAAAEPLNRQALAISERELGAEHPEVAVCCATLAAVLDGQAKYDEAEALYRRALIIHERTFGPLHPDIGLIWNNLGSIAQEQRRFAEADAAYHRALTIREATLGPTHFQVATTLSNLGSLRIEEDRLDEALPLVARARRIFEDTFGPAHPYTINCSQLKER